MPIICLCSPQGGCGRTTLAANLANAYAHRGNKVLLIDLNVQNALQNHFNLAQASGLGFVPHAQSVSDWGQFIVKVDTNLYLLPYGDTTWEQHSAFEHLMREEPETVRRNLSAITKNSGLVVIIDMPAGPHPALRALYDIIDLHIVTLVADGTAPLLLEKLEQQKFLGIPLNKNGAVRVILNKADTRSEMNHDIGVYLRQRVGGKLLGEVHLDGSMAAALANQKPLRLYRPSSAALFDIDSIEKALSLMLNITVGNNDASPTL